MRKLLLLIVSLLATIGTVGAQELDMYARIPADPAVVVGKLDNGMTYYLRHNPKPANQADFYIYHDVGAVQEEDSQNGLAHFLEHMAFNGTANLPGKTLIDYLETIGVKFGANLNASTGHEMTCYMMTDVPLSREGITDTTLLILHDWSRFIALEDEEIDKERGVILEEMRGGRDAGRRLMEESWPLVYNGSRDAYRNIIGTEEIIKNFAPETIRDFYGRWYRPDLQAIVIVGDIDVRHMEQKLIEVMKDIPAAVDPEPKQMPVIADNAEPLIGVFTDPELTSSQISLYIKRAPLPDEVNDMVIAGKIAVMNTLISQMANYRLQEMSQRADALFLYGVMQNGQMVRTVDAATFVAVARPGDVNGAFEALYGEVEKIRRWGFNEGELERAKTELLRGQEMIYDSRDDRRNGDFVNTYLGNFTRNTAMPSAEMEYEISSLLIGTTVLEEVNIYASQILPRANEVVIAMAPRADGLPVPTTDGLAAIITKVQGGELTPYEDNTVREPLIDRELPGGNVLSEEAGMFGSTVWTLSNGIKFVVKPTDFKADEVYLNAVSEGGMSVLPDADYSSAQLLATLIGFSGIDRFPAIELSKQLAGKMVGIQLDINNYSNGILSGGSSKDLETILQLMYLNFTSPRFDRADYESVMDKLRAQYANAELNPAVIFGDAVQRTIYPDQMRRSPLRKRLAEVDFERMPGIFKALYGNADDFTFILVGSFDPEAVKPMVEKYIGSLPQTPERYTWKDDGVRVAKGAVENRFPFPMETPKTTVLYAYSGGMEYGLKNSLAISILEQILNIRYTESIREEKGGTYSVSVGTQLVNLPVEIYSMTVQFDTDPGMADELALIVTDEIEKIAAAGPLAEDLAKIKEYMVKSRPESLRQNGTWMGYLQTWYVDGYDYFTGYDKALEEIDGDYIKAIAAKIISDGNLAKIIMEPAAVPDASGQAE